MPIFEGFNDENFSKVENSDGSVSYVLKTTVSEIVNVEKSLLEKLSTDTKMLDKINAIIAELSGDSSNAITSEDIQSILDNWDSTTSQDVNDMELEISVTQNKGKTNKLEISTNGLIIEMLFNTSDSEVSTTVNIELMNVLNISTEIKYANINTDSVTESMNVNMNITGVMDTKYSFNNTINFDNSINIEGFGTNNIVLNNYQGTQIENFVTQVAMAVVQKNSEQMQQLQFPEELGNPMLMWFVAPVMIPMYENSNSMLDRAEQAQEAYEQDALETEQMVTNTEAYLDEVLNRMNVN